MPQGEIDMNMTPNPLVRRVLRTSATSLVAAGVLAAVLGTWYVRAARVEASTEPPPVAVQRPAVDSYAELVARVAPAVVTVRSVRTVHQAQLPLDDEMLRRFFGGNLQTQPVPRREGGLGSGVVVTPDGYILTNNHVVDGAEKIRVDFTDGRSLEARVVGTDQASDLAVLKIPASGLTTVPMGDSEKARVGDVVLAIGNPLGVGQTVTMGIISGKGRATGGDDGAFEDFIQTDAPINQGNSGGALVNTRGELVGINSQILSPSGYNIGIGFAIPAGMAQNVMQQLITSGRVQRGMLGVTVQGVNADVAKSLGLGSAHGAIVADVTPGGPAAAAGLRPGDVILALNGRAVDSSNDLRNHVAPLGPGAKVTLQVFREGRQREIPAVLAELPADETRASANRPDAERGHYGMTVQPLTKDLAEQLDARSTSGVVVTDIDPAGVAAEAGLQAGDVVEQVDGARIGDVAGLKRALNARHEGRPALLLVNRQGRHLFVTLAASQG
jgi:Do/DeqQ family serine protease